MKKKSVPKIKREGFWENLVVMLLFAIVTAVLLFGLYLVFAQRAKPIDSIVCSSLLLVALGFSIGFATGIKGKEKP